MTLEELEQTRDRTWLVYTLDSYSVLVRSTGQPVSDVCEVVGPAFRGFVMASIKYLRIATPQDMLRLE